MVAGNHRVVRSVSLVDPECRGKAFLSGLDMGHEREREGSRMMSRISTGKTRGTGLPSTEMDKDVGGLEQRMRMSKEQNHQKTRRNQPEKSILKSSW